MSPNQSSAKAIRQLQLLSAGIKPPAIFSKSHIAAGLLICAMVSGCGLSAAQRGAIGTFSASTETMADAISREVVETRADVVDLRQRMLMLGSGKIKLDDPANDLDAAMDADEAQRRISACAALKTYGELLSTMATSNRTEELAAASGSFLTNLRNVKGVSISDEKAGAIGTLVVSIGNQVIEAHRKMVVAKVVQETQEPIQKVAAALKADFDVKEMGWMGTLKETDRQIFSESPGSMNSVIDNLKAGDELNGRKLSESDLTATRTEYLSLKTDSAKAVDDYVKLQPGILKAIDEMAKAHDALFYIVQHDEVITRGEIDTYIAQVAKLVDTVQVIRAKKHK